MPDQDAVHIPITGELDLHTFAPSETKAVLEAYFEACLTKKIYHVRVIHGKGTGTLRETVHSHLRHSSLVDSFRLGDETTGGWGATLVTLRRTSSTHP